MCFLFLRESARRERNLSPRYLLRDFLRAVGSRGMANTVLWTLHAPARELCSSARRLRKCSTLYAACCAVAVAINEFDTESRNLNSRLYPIKPTEIGINAETVYTECCCRMRRIGR